MIILDHLPKDCLYVVSEEPGVPVRINSIFCAQQRKRPCVGKIIHARLEEGVESISFGGRTLLSCEKDKSCNREYSNSCCLGTDKACKHNDCHNLKALAGDGEAK